MFGGAASRQSEEGLAFGVQVGGGMKLEFLFAYEIPGISATAGIREVTKSIEKKRTYHDVLCGYSHEAGLFKTASWMTTSNPSLAIRQILHPVLCNSRSSQVKRNGCLMSTCGL